MYLLKDNSCKNIQIIVKNKKYVLIVHSIKDKIPIIALTIRMMSYCLFVMIKRLKSYNKINECVMM